MTKKLSSLSLLGLVLTLWACNKASDLGAFLEEDNEIGVFYDSVPLNTTTIEDESTVTWSLGRVFIPTNSVGRLDDPYLGESRANLNFQIGIASEPDFTDAMLDSVVLTLAYDTSRFSYGPPDENWGIEVYQLESDLYADSTYYANSSFEEGSLIGYEDNIRVSLDDTITVVEPRDAALDTIRYLPHLRVKLDEGQGLFGQTLLDLDVSDFASNEIFRQKIKGLIVKPTGTSGKMVYFNMYAGLSRINLYYTQRDTAKLVILPVLSNSITTNVAVNTYEHDYTGSAVAEVLDDPSPSDSLLFVQSMGGPSVQIDFPDLSLVENSTINHATLVFNLAYLAGDDTLGFPPIEHLVLEEVTPEGDRFHVADIGNLLTSAELRLFFGGDLRMNEDTGVGFYSMNVTNHFQRMLRGEAGTSLVLTNRYKGALTRRSILHGASDSNLGARLFLTYSEL